MMSNQDIPPAQTLDVDTVDRVIRNLLADMRSELDMVQAVREAMPAGTGPVSAQHRNLQQRSLAMYDQCNQLHTLLEQRRVDLETARIQQSVYNMNIVASTGALGSIDGVLTNVRKDIARLHSSVSAPHGNALLLESETGNSNLVILSDSVERHFKNASDQVLKAIDRNVNMTRGRIETLVTDLTTANTTNLDNIRRDVARLNSSLQALLGSTTWVFADWLDNVNTNVANILQALDDINTNVTNTLQALPDSTATVLAPFFDDINANVTSILQILPSSTVTAITPLIVNNNTDESKQK